MTNETNEVVEGTVMGRHGEGCTCDELMADIAALALTESVCEYLRANADRVTAAGLDIPNILAGKNVTGESLTDIEKLVIEIGVQGFRVGKNVTEIFAAVESQPPAYAYFDSIDSLDALLDLALAEEAPHLAE